MAAKGDLLHSKLDETESLLRLENYFRDSAYGNSVIQQNYREENAALFDQYEQMYRDKSYTLYTDSLTMEYRLLTQLVNEYDTVAGYTDFLESVQTKAGQLAGISIFQNDETGYDLKTSRSQQRCMPVWAKRPSTTTRKRVVYRHLLCFY